MARYPLQGVIALGVLVTSISGAGVVAVFTDRATTGENSAVTGERPHFEALQLATATLDSSLAFVCGTPADDLATPLLTMTNAQPGDGISALVCLINTGSVDLNTSVTAIDVVNTETACSGDEATFDATCEPGGAGELGSVLLVGAIRDDCATASGSGYADTPNDLGAGSSISTGVLSAGATACLAVNTVYHVGTPELDQQLAQTDQVTWRFAFDGTQ